MNHPKLYPASEQELIEALLLRTGDMFDQASFMQRLCQEYGFSQSALAKKIGVSQSSVGNKLRLLQFSVTERTLIKDFGMSERHARALLRVEKHKRIKIIETVGNLHLTVGETETLVEKYTTESIDASKRLSDNHMSIPFSIESFLQQTQRGAERLRSLGSKVSCLTEAEDGCWRITVVITD